MENFHSVYAKRVPAIERAKERLESLPKEVAGGIEDRMQDLKHAQCRWWVANKDG